MRAFDATIRYFRPEQAAGLTVVDIPPDVTAELGGLKQLKVTATINGRTFDSNTMPAGGGRLALSVNGGIRTALGVAVGDPVTVELELR